MGSTMRHARISVTLALAVLGTCAALRGQRVALAGAPAGNLVENPSFEERSGPDKKGGPWGRGYPDGIARSPFAHWGYNGFWDNGDYDIKLGQGRTGRLCARLVCREKGRGGICTEAIRVPVGTKLQFKGWFKAIGAKGGACQVNFEGDPGEGWASIDLPSGSDYGWTEVAAAVTVPKPKNTTGGKVDIYLFIYMRTYGELWIDDVTLTPVAE
ncbi:MAG: hypothetical protein ABSG86_05730 [Thermoguttaceae bacterium]|jgi:hypothetical protein